jgi:hypothetical protein
MKKTIAILTVAASLLLASSANAVYGDKFGMAPVNVPGAQTAPALPGTHAFWAGACDIGTAPPIGTPMGPLGGVGSRPAQILAPDTYGAGFGFLFGQTPVAAPPLPPHCIEWGAPAPETSETSIWNAPPSWRLPALTQAGARGDGSASFAYARNAAGVVDGSLDNIYVDLPPGFVGNPGALPKCSGAQFNSRPLRCPPETQVGILHLEIYGALFNNFTNLDALRLSEDIYPIYNIEPRRGNAAELGFGYASGERATNVRLVAKVRTNGDFGVTTFAGQVPAALPVISQQITLWAVPWAAHNDRWRAPLSYVPLGDGGCATQPGVSPSNGYYVPPAGFATTGCQAHYSPSWGKIRPFLTNETDCNPGPTVTMRTDSFDHPGAFTAEHDPDPTDPDWKTYSSVSPAVTGCEKLGFEPSITLDPKGQGGAATQATVSPSGFDVELRIPQNNDLPFDPPPNGAPQIEVEQYVADAEAYWRSDQGLATSHLKDTVVTLPEGMTLNPAAADGQGVCTMQQIGVTDLDSPQPPAIRFNNAPVACPESSKVGEVTIETPLLGEADWPSGEVYLAAQGENPFGSDFAIYIAVKSPERGLTVKLAGRVAPDPSTGRLTTSFAQNPELPFDQFSLRFKGGPRAPLATPVTCGSHASVNSFAPYSSPGNPVVLNDAFELGSSPAGGCPATKEQRPLNVGFSAGSTELVAGANSSFTARFIRPDGNQELDRIELTTPEGLAAKLAGVPYCPEAGIARAGARTARGDGARERADSSCPAASQVGTTTIGAGAGRSPFFVAGKVYLAGPYKGAPVSLAFIVPAVAGPFDLGVQVVRTALNINPKTAQVTAVSDTIPKILRGIPLRIRDIRVDLDRPGFVVNPTDCAEQMVSGRVFGASGALSAVTNRFQIAECTRLGFKPGLNLRVFGGVKRGDYQRLRATVTARPGDANISRAEVTLPHSFFLAQEHIRTVCTRVQFAADACPAASIYGAATAISPLLDAPLSGPVYLRSSDNLLPDLVAALKGPDHQPIEIELAGRTDSKNKGIRNTFDVVPDAPVSKFTLEMQGGKKSLIVNSRNICQTQNKAAVRLNGQNGATRNFRTLVVNSKCKKARKGKKKGQAKSQRGSRAGSLRSPKSR